MSVYFNKEAAQLQLNTAESSYVMQIHDGLLLHLYWGPRLDDRDHSYMHWEQGRAAFSCRMENCSGPILDDLRLEYPTWGRGDNRSPAAEVLHPDGTNIADFRYVSHRIADGKAPLPGLPAMYANEGDDVQTLEIVLEDKPGGMRLSLFYSVFYELDVITRHAVFTNLSESDVELGAALSAAVDFDRADLDVITNYGTHCVERQIERGPLRRGKTVLASRRGASSHVHNPFLILCGRAGLFRLVLGFGRGHAVRRGARAHRAESRRLRVDAGAGRVLHHAGGGALLCRRRAGRPVAPLPQSLPSNHLHSAGIPPASDSAHLSFCNSRSRLFYTKITEYKPSGNPSQRSLKECRH